MAPCNEYYSVLFNTGPLGFSVVRRRPSDPILGDTIVESLQHALGYPGQAERGNVQPGDVVIAVQNQYVAFTSHEETVAIIKSAPRPLVVHYCRPNRQQWERLQSSPDENIISGMLQKQSGGFFNKWKSRKFTLSRSQLRCYNEGAVKWRVDVREISNLSSDGNGLDKSNAFSFRTNQGEVVVAASSFDEKLYWLHALDCALHCTFDVPLPPNHIKSVATSAQPVAAPPPPIPPPNRPPRFPSPIANGNTRGELSSSSKLLGQYWMLQHSKVTIGGSVKSGGERDVLERITQLPQEVKGFDNVAKIDFALERDVLDRHQEVL